MALFKERDDSFALGMSLAEIAFLIVFVLLLLAVVTRVEDAESTEGDGQTNLEKVNTAEVLESGNGDGSNPPPPLNKPVVAGGGPTDESTEGSGQTNLGEENTAEVLEPGNGNGSNPPPPLNKPVVTGGGSTDESTEGSGQTNLGEENTAEVLESRNGDGSNPLSPLNESVVRGDRPGSGQPAPPPATPGVGPDACWRDADGDIEFLYNIVFQEDGLDVEQAWPSRRDIEADEINARELLGKGIRKPDYTPVLQSILDWSDDQDPPCRHYFYTHVDDVINYRLLRNVKNYLYSDEEEDPRD